MPPTCGRTVAVASGVTVPSALSVTLMSPLIALATPTGCAPWLITAAAAGCLGIDRPDQQRQQRQAHREPHHPRQARIVARSSA